MQIWTWWQKCETCGIKCKGWKCSLEYKNVKEDVL